MPAELSYVDLGEATYRASNETAAPDNESESLAASAQGPVLSFLGIIPIGERFAMYGRAGIALFDSEGTVTVTTGDVVNRFSDSTQRSNGVYGIGGQFTANDRFDVRLEWSRYADVGSEDITGESDVDVFALGLRYNFH